MDLRTYAVIIRKYLPFILAASLVGLLGGFAVYTTTSKQYAAHVQFYVSTPVPESGTAQSAGQFATGRMTSYVELLSSQELGARVVKASGVGLTPEQVAKRISANTTVESVLVKATVTDSDPQRALAVARGVAKVFGPMVDELDNAGRTAPVVDIKTVSAPTVGAKPVAPNRKMMLALGLGLGLALSVGAALVREILDNSVKSPDEARDLAGAPVIGTIPLDKAAGTGQLLSADEVDAPRAEAHRKLRTNLAFLDATKKASVLLFTAPAERDGTSTVAANAALSFAETGERVCLVEADLRTAGALPAFGLPSGTPGLSELLAGRVPLDRAITRWKGEPALDIIDAGELPPNPAALLGSARFAEVLDELRERYDRVVLDSPALLPVADAAVLAGLSDGVVLVTRAGSTTADQLTGARSALGAVRARVLGVVVNRARSVPGAEARGKRS